MLRRPIISNSIVNIGYDPNKLTLAIEFSEGGIYHYYNVPVSVYLNFVNANSRGRFFNHHIKPYYSYHRKH